MTHEERLAAAERPGDDRVYRRHARIGMASARERIDAFFDPGSFREIGAFRTHQSRDFGLDGNTPPGDGVITGHGLVNGRATLAYAQDFAVLDGTVGGTGAKKISELYDRAMATGVPIVGLLHSNGARLQEGFETLEACAHMFQRMVRTSGLVPHIVCAMGLCAGIPAYIASLADLVFMVRDKGYLFTASPAVIKVATGEEVDIKDLGGAEMHATTSGVAHFLADSEAQAIEALRAILGYLPSHNREDPPLASALAPPPVDWSTIVPADPWVPFDVRDLIGALADRASFFELHRDWGRSIVVGFARLGGHSIGVVANQSLEGAGALDVTSSRKAARFIRLCDAFNVPLIFLVDVPGFTPGLEQERAGLLLAGAQLYTAMDADVPRISVVTRKCYGGAYVMLNSKACGGDLVMAWPEARIAVVGAEAACEILYRKEARRAEDPQAFRAERIQAFRDTWESAHAAAGRGIVDRVVRPEETRAALLDSLNLTATKRVVDRPPKRIQNIPL